MTTTQIAIGLLITLCGIIKPILYRPCAQYFPARISAVFTSIWLAIFTVAIFPFFGHLLIDKLSEIFTSVFFVVSILRGIFLWAAIKYQQVVNKESTSSSTFYTFISLSIASLLNNLFFNEGLSINQILCICGFGILGGIFFIIGDAKRLTTPAKTAFIIAMFCTAFSSVSDHLVNSSLGWYPQLFISSITLLILSLLSGVSQQDLKNIFLNKTNVIAGIFYAFMDFLLVFTSVNIMPVSFVSVFHRSSVPIVMLISAFIYREQNWKNQLIFGISAFTLALILMFSK